MYVSGRGTGQRDGRGRPVVDDSFLLLAHAGHRPVSFTLPGPPWADSYELLLDTALEEQAAAPGTAAAAGREVRVGPRSLRLYRVAAGG
jgi:glycogen operon protein